MVCLIRNVVTNELQGLQRTAIGPNGEKIKNEKGKTLRMCLGAVKLGAIKIDADEDVTMGLCIGEGVETCLAGCRIGYRPIWSVINAAGVAAFPVLPGLDGLTIFVEKGEANKQACEACAARWDAAGVEVRFVNPLSGKDLNDELQEVGQ
jgi:hypothetical protein